MERDDVESAIVGIIGVLGIVLFLSGLRFLSPADTVLRMVSGGFAVVFAAMYFRLWDALLIGLAVLVVCAGSFVGFQIAFHRECARQLEPLREEFEWTVRDGGYWDDHPSSRILDLILVNKQHLLARRKALELGGWYVNRPEEGRAYPTTNSWYLYVGCLPESLRNFFLGPRKLPEIKRLPSEEVEKDYPPLYSPPTPKPRQPKPERPTVSPATTLHTVCGVGFLLLLN